MVQSNNATYGGTGQIEQQFAITRARAMEARREIAVATTNSVSGFIDRDGRVVAAHQRVHRRQHGGRDAAARRSPRPSGSPRGWTGPGRAWPAARGRARRRLPAGAAIGPAEHRSADDRPVRTASERRRVAMSESDERELGSHPGHHPDLQRGREHRPIVARVRTRCRPRTSWSPTTTHPTAPAAGRRAGRRRRPRARAAPAGQGRAGRGVPGRLRLGHRPRLRRPGRDGRRRVAPARAAAACWPRWSTPTWSRARAGSRAARSSTGRSPGSSCPAAATCGPGSRSASRCGTPPAVTAPSGRETLLRPRSEQHRLGGLLLPGRSGLAGAEGGLPGRRGADHLRRAGARRLQDEPADRRRGADPDDPVGDRSTGPGSCATGSGEERPR